MTFNSSYDSPSNWCPPQTCAVCGYRHSGKCTDDAPEQNEKYAFMPADDSQGD